jgi:ankyrin repeat protein
VAEYLLLNGADPLAVDRPRHNTALMWAAARGRADVVARLLGGRAVRPRAVGVRGVGDSPCIDEDGR